MVKPAKKTAKKKGPEPDQGLVIEVGWQYDGGVYMLSWRSKELIREKYPDAVINPGILLGYDKTEDYNRFHRPYWETLAQIITGLTPEQIAALGGISIYDPRNEKVIWRWDPGSLKAG
ncbi:MAG TPA: hypothetical protein VKA46_37405 [Gemmataceae bacterium]|nr:hypothetical protein [Gemmataceae bacterium]